MGILLHVNGLLAAVLFAKRYQLSVTSVWQLGDIDHLSSLTPAGRDAMATWIGSQYIVVVTFMHAEKMFVL